jgi:hypothetical protein
MSEDLSLRLAVLEATLLERSVAQERALHIALAANEKRLDILNEWRQTYADLLTGTVSRTEVLNLVDGLRDRLDDLVKPDYLLWGVVIAAVLGLAGGVWMGIGMKVDSAVAPLALQIEHLKTTSAACSK